MKEVFEFLDSLGINYELDEHEPVFTIEAVKAAGLDKKGMIPVNLFLMSKW